MPIKKTFVSADPEHKQELEFYVNDDGNLFIELGEPDPDVSPWSGWITLGRDDVSELIRDLQDALSRMSRKADSADFDDGIVWIPVLEREPTTDDEYLITFQSETTGDRFTGTGDWRDGEWFLNSDWMGYEVAAWASLPEPLENENQDPAIETNGLIS